ncbi:putative hydroxypyruvate reductase [uncultured Defluviicoccus sp.]|uniref:Putative hydroxypyruvate reductase n=1 Tax=metagenome TaxID=256318 RepID=A0A380T9R5_9ZZZZ|nr:putative hydroxypyruvate reductase [uncultured Defluviicoccus sp.]
MNSPAQPEALLRRMLQAVINSASAETCVPPNLPDPPRGRTVVIGAGKASAAMALAFEQHWKGEFSGLVVTRYGHGAPCTRIEVVEAGHPVPDLAGVEAARRIQSLVSGLSRDDLVVCLLSGGGSALLVDPAPGIALEKKQQLTQALLLSGATISEINYVRKHLSRVKGGRLALAAAPARVVTLAISDVPGDAPALIASGPTVPDPSTRFEALHVLTRYGIEPSPGVSGWLNDPACETPKAGFGERCVFKVVAAPAAALEAAATVARREGWDVLILGDAIEGETRIVASQHAAVVRRMAEQRRRCIILSGGETTVTVRGKGRGGRNSEFLLALATELDGMAGVHALAADTDGIDGSEDNAGAVCGPGTLAAAKRSGVSAEACLANNDAYGFFEAAGGLVLTGPTRTNVNDFRAIAVSADGSSAGAKP